MIDPQWLHAAIEIIALVDRVQPVHSCVEFQRNAEGVPGPEGSGLIGPVDPLKRQVLLLKEVSGLVEVVLIEDLEAEVSCGRLVALPENDAVMPALLHGPEVDRVGRLVGDLKAERVDIEGT